MKLISRDSYLKVMTDVIGTPDIKVLTGVRRAGKSKLLEALSEYLRRNNPLCNIIHINFNLTEFESLLEYHALERYAESRFKADKQNFLLVDEIQMCPSFEKAMNSLQAKEKFDIYITGSNAFLQSSDLATLFVGRTFEIPVFPFSFSEYIEYFPSSDRYDSLTRFITEGGMAGSYLYPNTELKFQYINNEVLNSLIVRDIVNKQKIRNTALLASILDFLMDNIGSLTSIRSISDTLASNRTKADHKTVSKYIGFLCSAFAFYRIPRFDLRGNRYLKSEGKYYLCDQSFKYAHLGMKNMDYGHVLENIVAIELLRRGYEVYSGTINKKEIDFVAIKAGERHYYQVAYSIADEKTFKREINPLLSIKDGYRKTLITRIYQPSYQYEGIEIIDASDWLSIPQI